MATKTDHHHHLNAGAKKLESPDPQVIRDDAFDEENHPQITSYPRPDSLGISGRASICTASPVHIGAHGMFLI